MADKVVDIGTVKWGKTQTSGAAEWQRRQKRRVRSHSRLVVSLKVILPSIAALLIGFVIIWPQLKAQQEDTFSLAATEFESLKKPQQQAMVNPRFFTIDEKGEPLNMTASDAFEIPGDTRQIQLNDIKADVLMDGDRWYALDAAKGIYTQTADTMELLERVNLYTEDGYEAETVQALIHLNNRDVEGRTKVNFRAPQGHGTADDGFEMLQKGTVFKLLGKTKIIFNPDEMEN